MSIRVLIVDDSAAYRGLLTRLLAQAPDIEVVGEAADAAEAREAIKRLAPDVLTLDIEMPGMNGLDFLERLMRLHPLPVVMVSALGRQQAEVVLQAIALGAVDFVVKPDQADARVLSAFAERLVALLRIAAGVRPPRARPAEPVASVLALPVPCRSGSLIAIGASTGGTEAIRSILAALPANVPPILIVQHLPERFVPAFAARLDEACALTVRLAQDGEPLRAGHAYLSPGRRHLAVALRGDRLVASLVDAPKVNFHRPSVDVLFESVARIAGPLGMALLLTGMGKDGAAGLAQVRAAGGYTLAQDEASSVVFGMPAEAIRLDAACEVAELGAMAASVCRRLALLG